MSVAGEWIFSAHPDSMYVGDTLTLSGANGALSMTSASCAVCDGLPCSVPAGTRVFKAFRGIDGVVSADGPVLRLFPPCALVAHAQGSSGVVATMPFVWRGHTKSLTTRARPNPDLVVWLE